MQSKQNIETAWSDDMLAVIDDYSDLNLLDRLKASARKIGAASAVCRKDGAIRSPTADQIKEYELTWEKIATLLTTVHCKLMELELKAANGS
jgi:hypothetical protein